MKERGFMLASMRVQRGNPNESRKRATEKLGDSTEKI